MANLCSVAFSVADLETQTGQNKDPSCAMVFLTNEHGRFTCCVCQKEMEQLLYTENTRNRVYYECTPCGVGYDVLSLLSCKKAMSGAFAADAAKLLSVWVSNSAVALMKNKDQIALWHRSAKMLHGGKGPSVLMTVGNNTTLVTSKHRVIVRCGEPMRPLVCDVLELRSNVLEKDGRSAFDSTNFAMGMKLKKLNQDSIWHWKEHNDNYSQTIRPSADDISK